MFGKRKGISTFIATLLLMVLAVSAGVVIYAYTMGYMGGFGGTDTLGAMSIDQATLEVGTTNVLTVNVRNIGKTAITFDTVYFEGSSITFTANPSTPLPEGDVATITCNPTTIVAGTTYSVKIIGADNTQVSFTVKAK